MKLYQFSGRQIKHINTMQLLTTTHARMGPHSTRTREHAAVWRPHNASLIRRGGLRRTIKATTSLFHLLLFHAPRSKPSFSSHLADESRYRNPAAARSFHSPKKASAPREGRSAVGWVKAGRLPALGGGGAPSGYRQCCCYDAPLVLLDVGLKLMPQPKVGSADCLRNGHEAVL